MEDVQCNDIQAFLNKAVKIAVQGFILKSIYQPYVIERTYLTLFILNKLI